MVRVCLFGESPSPAMGVVINGLAPGIQLDLDFLDRQLDKTGNATSSSRSSCRSSSASSWEKGLSGMP